MCGSLMFMLWSTYLQHQQQQSIVQVSATVIAHELRRSCDCSRSFLLDYGSMDAKCWGARVAFAFPSNEEGTHNCTVSRTLLPESYSEDLAQSVLMEKHSIGAIQALYALSDVDECQLEAPRAPEFGEKYFLWPLVSLACLLFFVIGVGSMAVLLQAVFETPIRAWCQRWGLLTRVGGAGGGKSKTGTALPLVASAPLP